MYVPDDLDLRRRIVSDHHDTPVAGHPGALATTRSVRLLYWWPGMVTFIRKYVAGCATCQQFKVNTRPSKPSLYPIPSGSSRLFGSLGIDFMTDLPVTDDGSDSIMVVVDHGLTKGVVLVPTTKLGLSAERTAQLFLDNVYSRFGLPDTALTDRGPQFDSEFWKELCKSLGIKTKLTTAFHPQTNGGTERVNREIQLYLSVFCINNPTSWSKALKKAEFVHNNRPHADRNQSPFELMYGAQPKAIIEPYYRGDLSNPQRMQQLEQWRSDALLAHEYARQRMKDRIKSTFQPFKKGDKVWLEGTNLKLGYNKKITTKREGPFTITEVLGPVNYRLKLPDKWRMRDNFHATLLTPYEENATHGKNFPHPPPDLIEGEQEWEVERIVSHKGKKNRQYQVKWQGYEEMTWEPEENLQHSQDSIADYWKRKAKKPRNQ
jgi:transposase InsO family protein